MALYFPQNYLQLFFLLNIDYEDKFVNTHLFTEMADFYRKNKQYTFYQEDSIPHRQLRKREENRREHGFKAPCLIHNGKLKEVRIFVVQS